MGNINQVGIYKGFPYYSNPFFGPYVNFRVSHCIFVIVVIFAF